MEDQIRRLREQPEPLWPPATADELSEVRAVLGVERLPGAVLSLYADHGGMDAAESSLPMRLLTPEAAIDAIRGWREFGVPFEDTELGVFWADDDGNGAGVFAAGPLRDRVFLIDHEEPSSEPRWIKVESFYDALLDGRDYQFGWWELWTDYPRRPYGRYPPEEDDLADDFFRIHQREGNSDQGRRAAFRFLALSTPDRHEEQVLLLLDSDDMWLQERAANILEIWGNPDGGWGRPQSIESLARVARSGTHNGRIGAMAGLRRIRTPEAKAVRIELRREMGPQWNVYLGQEADESSDDAD
jgi:hypothetical protein